MDPFATLGLPRRYEIDQTQLEVNYRELQRALHPDRHAGASPSQRRMSTLKAVEVNDAYRALKDDLRRAEALLALYDGEAAPKAAPPEDPEFLMQMLELREALAEARASNRPDRVQVLHKDVEALQGATRAGLNAAFTTLALPESSRASAAAELGAARRAIGRLKYFRRFLDEVDAAHEQELG